MNESRVDYLVSLFVDDMLSETESRELAELIEDQPELLEELQAQLEAADMVSQSENDRRSPSRFLEELQLRLDEPVMPDPNEDEPALPVEEEIADEPLEHHERAMIHAILHLDETPVRELMVPRVDVVSLDVGSTIDQAVPKILESGHSRLPVYEESPDNVIGILYARDLLAATARGHSADPPTVRDLVRPCFFVPESKRVDEMLEEFQERLRPFHGEIKGIITSGRVISGIGNAYSDELLFAAMVYPFRRKKALATEELRRIYTCSREVVEAAIPVLKERMGENIHTKIRDFLKVHNGA